MNPFIDILLRQACSVKLSRLITTDHYEISSVKTLIREHHSTAAFSKYYAGAVWCRVKK